MVGAPVAVICWGRLGLEQLLWLQLMLLAVWR